MKVSAPNPPICKDSPVSNQDPDTFRTPSDVPESRPGAPGDEPVVSERSSSHQPRSAPPPGSEPQGRITAIAAIVALIVIVAIILFVLL